MIEVTFAPLHTHKNCFWVNVKREQAHRNHMLYRYLVNYRKVKNYIVLYIGNRTSLHFPELLQTPLAPFLKEYSSCSDITVISRIKEKDFLHFKLMYL